MAGHLEQAKVFAKYDIKPIFACELYHGIKTEHVGRERDQNHLIVGALTDQGLRNLWSMMDASASNFRYVSRVSTDMLRMFAEGTYATSACALSLVSKGLVKGDTTWANEYLDIWRDDFYIALSTYPADKAFKDGGEEVLNQGIINEALVQFGLERGLPFIYEDDAHRARKDQYEIHDAYVAMSTGQTIYTPVEERKMWHPEEAMYIKDEGEIREALSYLPSNVVDEAIRNSEELGERVNASLPQVDRHLPVFFPKACPWLEGEDKKLSSPELFVKLVEEGIVDRYGDADDEVWDRAMREVEVFLDDSQGIKLYDYFLMGWDLIQYCKENDIETGPGRGSSAGAITAYALGITDVDPLPYDLIFERFWNAGRADGFPDIDMDFPRMARRDILHYLEDRWGKDKVRPIGTVTRMKPKSVADKTWKACAVRGDELSELKKILDEIPDLEIHGVNQIGWARETEPGKTIYVMDHVGQDIVDWIDSKPEDRQEILIEWVWFCQMLCSRVANYGIHPSGVIVSDVDLPDQTPCRWNKDEQLRITQFPMDDVDNRGFVKLDILGLRTLDTLTEFKRIMLQKDVDIQWSGLEKSITPDEMWELLAKGLTMGIFQVEDKPAVRKLVKEFKPRSVKDLSIIVALNRPGPLRAGKGEKESTADKFIKRRNGTQEVEYPHEFLKDVLDETYGLFLYQEQVIQFFNKMGYSLGDSDAVRKILGKKKPEALKALFDGTGDWEGKGFMEIAPKHVGDKAESIWNTIVGFASYSFNKSHSVAYGVIVFRTVFAKWLDGNVWTQSTVLTDEKRAGKHIAEARRMGFVVSPPDILLSQAQISEDEDGNILYGFSDIKGVKGESAEYVCELREKYGYVVQTREGLETALGVEKKDWTKRKKAAKEALQPFDEKSPGQKLQSNKIDALQCVGAFDAYEDRQVSDRERKEFEQELLGVVLTDDSHEVLESHRAELDDMELDTYEDMNEPWEEDRKFIVPGIVSNIKLTKTKANGDEMAIVTIEYEGEEREFAVFPKQWKSHKWLFQDRTPGIFTIRHAMNNKTGKSGYNFDRGQKLS